MERKFCFIFAAITSLIFSINTAKAEATTMVYNGYLLCGTKAAVDIPRGGEYKFDYSLFVGDNETPSIEGANKFTFSVAPFVRCFPMVVAAEHSGEFAFTPTVSTGYPFEIGQWQNREFTFYMAFPGDSYEKITTENPKHTVSFSADTSFVRRENRETFTFNHNISDYDVDSLFFVTANENAHSLDTICIVMSNTTTGIISVNKNVSTSDNRIFSIDGTYQGTDDANLPKGIYIQNRRKKIIH